MEAMGQALPFVDFAKIRSHSGSQSGAFEELCVQVFYRQHGERGRFVRVRGAGGDGGVESYVIRPDGSEYGLQSKWFTALGPSQWQQIDSSVRTALKTHPKLTSYTVAVPVDRTPTQIAKWDEHVRRWQNAAGKPKKTRRVTFEWLGLSEFTGLLSQSCFHGMLAYWFGLPQYTAAWMDGTIASAVRDLDRRYSPKHHVETGAGLLVDGFAWSPTLRQQLRSTFADLAVDARKAQQTLQEEAASGGAVELVKACTVALKAALDFEFPVLGWPVVELSRTAASAAHATLEQLRDQIRILRTSTEKLPEGDKQVETHRTKAQVLDNMLERLGGRLRTWLRLLDRFALVDRQHLLLLGNAGTGKSHLLASVVRSARQRGQPALLLLGERFTGNQEPWAQVRELLGWRADEWSLLAALNQAGMTANAPAILCIDALNESGHPGLWLRHLHGFADRLQEFPFVRLVVSCRTDFAPITLPADLHAETNKSWATVEHLGFGEELFEAVGNYFEGYHVTSSHFPPLIEEFRNPLFLRLFCEAFEKQSLPPGPVTLSRVMETRIDRLATKLQVDIDCAPDQTRAAIYAVADAISANGGHPLPIAALRKVVDPYSPTKHDSRCLYTHLRSSGILVETRGIGTLSGEPAINVRFPFERFSDYFVASALLRDIPTKSLLRKAFARGGRVAQLLTGDGFWRQRGILGALAILVPERFHLEVVDLISEKDRRRSLLNDFLVSMPWRSPQSFTGRSLAALRASLELGMDSVLKALLHVATIPGHPYNATYLHKRLSPMRLPERDKAWSATLASLAQDSSSDPASMIAAWAARVRPELISDEQARLAATVLVWSCSTNHRGLRARATRGAIALLSGRAKVATALVNDLCGVDDPYVAERLWAIVCGVAMRERDTDSLHELALSAYQRVFAAKRVQPNILIRDFAQSILEVAAHRKCLPKGVDHATFRPPFMSTWPNICSEDAADRLAKRKGWERIASSVRPEARMPYGDFGRYVMEACVHHFASSRDGRIPKDQHYDIGFDGEVARRWVLQRVRELGWTPRLFKEYEDGLPFGRQGFDEEAVKVERISKKYQWIALHELLGYLSDHYPLKTQDDGKVDRYEGAWQVGIRDFDPSSPVETESPGVAADEDGETIGSGEPGNEGYPDPFEDPSDLRVMSTTGRLFATPEGFATYRFGKLLGTKHKIGMLRMWCIMRSTLVAF